MLVNRAEVVGDVAQKEDAVARDERGGVVGPAPKFLSACAPIRNPARLLLAEGGEGTSVVMVGRAGGGTTR